MSKKFDVLVLGEGLAGAISALKAAEMGAEVAILSSSTSPASAWAQGGIVYKGDGDPSKLKEDILNSGVSINNPEAVNLLVNKGPTDIENWLQKTLNISFDRNDKGELDLCLEAAHSIRRILHVKDFTGKGILNPLLEKIESHPKIHRLKGTLIELILSDRHGTTKNCEYLARKVLGAYYLDSQSMVNKLIAQSTVMATGGFSGVFQHSSGPSANIGAGISAAHRAGAKTLHLEFIQFHPTTFYKDGHPRTLLTEALRGDGAILVDENKNRFIDEMAPRDQVARAIHEKIASSNGSCVYLDLRKIQSIEEHFPGVAALLKKNKINPLEDLVPVVPASHYTMGGVWTDMNGETSLKGLWACGEVACTGLHGANRLASTSLLEALVFGLRAGENAARNASLVCVDQEIQDWMPAEEDVDPVLLQQDWSLLRQTMWNYVGLIRTEKRLERAASLINELRNEVESFYKQAKLNDSLVNLRHAILVASLTLYSALRRKKSLGTHYIES
jgi:L-aspartate oxidase